MSNLGFYQKMTTFAKKLGGPQKLFGVVAIGGYVILRTFEAGGKKAVKFMKEIIGNHNIGGLLIWEFLTRKSLICNLQ